MDIIEANYVKQCSNWSDIYLHLENLYKYSKECETVTELGMRSVVSTWAFACGLLHNGSENKRLTSVDLDYSPNIEEVKKACRAVGIKFSFIMGSDLEIERNQTDLLFIDTFHVYAQLKEELALYADKTNKYIIMHDTDVDGIYGECIRNGWDAHKIASETGFKVEDILKGLQPAIDEFLEEHKEWKLKEVFTYNHGLTVLEKVQQ